jgi:hypothetical protein
MTYYNMASSVGFPKELQNPIDYSLPASVSSYNVKVVPSNLSSVVSPTTTLGAAAANIAVAGNGANIILDVPAGQSKSVFIDPRFSTLNFRVKYSVTQGATASIITSATLRSHALAFFDRMYIQSQSGVLLDDVNLYGVIADQLNALEVDVAQRDALALMYGFQYEAGAANSQNNVQGHSITGIDASTPTASQTTDVYYSYSVPLLNSLIGKGASKFFQIGATSKLQLVLQTAAVLPLSIVVAAAAGAVGTMAITMDNISLSLQYIDIGAEGVKMLDKGGLQYYSGITYRASTTTLPSTSGAVSLLTGLRGSSVRNIITRCTEASTLSTAGCINYLFDSKMPQATSIQYLVNGLTVPSNPVDLLRAPATAYSFLQECNGSFNTYEFKSGMAPDRYCVTVAPAPSLSDRDVRVASSTSSAYNQAQWAFGYNMEKVSKAGILDGANLNAGNTFLNMVISTASTNTLTFIFIAKMDVIYVLDTATGDLTVRL